ncbi:hypothetical protein RI129_005674 [Pyrocoelia pectoralis]|uniref:Putative nuclease HARBI1 n=1 Tax=Pyrocoelia pectoralis TaxID=417401 RepID=A0AAN7VIX0_9COLE
MALFEFEDDLVLDVLEEDDEEVFVIIDLIEHGLPRQVYERADYFHQFDDAQFRRRFRLSRETVLFLLEHIEEHLEFPNNRNHCVSPINQLLVSLRYYATAGHLLSQADFTGMHTSTVSRIIVRVSEAIAALYPVFCTFPTTNEEIRQNQRDFFDIARFPRVIGCVDCTHVRIQSPGGDNAEVFRNRKCYFSINVQGICNANLKIINMVARWPGSSHDATIFNSSDIHREFEEGAYRNCVLLGDCGYANRSYLLTPLIAPATAAEQLYNESHIRTRNSIERCFGVLKRRFPVLAYGCRLKTETILTVIVATAVLHNIAIQMREGNPPPLPEEVDGHIFDELLADGQVPNIDYNIRGNGHGNAIRQQIILNYFSTL